MKPFAVLVLAVILMLSLLPAALAQPDAPGDPPSAQPDAPASSSPKDPGHDDAMSYTGSGWRIGRSEIWEPSLALDAQDRPHFSSGAWQGAVSLLKYWYLDEDGWHPETVPGTDHVSWTSSIALSADGAPHILFAEVDGSSELRYAFRDASGWHVESIANQTGVASNRSLALDSNGSAHICFVDNATGQLMAGCRNARGWTLEPVDAQSHAGESCSLALNGQSQPRIAYVDTSSASLKLASRDAAGWYVETVDNASDGAVSLAVDSAGYAHVGYIWEQAGILVAKYAQRDVYGWRNEIASNARGAGRDVLALAIAASGQPLLIVNCTYLEHGSAGWNSSSLPDCEDSYGTLAVDSQGRRHAAAFSGWFTVPGNPGPYPVYLIAPGDLSAGFWATQRLSTPDHGFFFVDDSTGWAMKTPTGSKLYRTVDGGITWQEVYDNSNPFYRRVRVDEVFFVDAQHGWIRGWWERPYDQGYFIAHTHDGGINWIDSGLPPCQISADGTNEIDQGIHVQSPDDTLGLGDRDIWFSDSQHGWVGWCFAMQRTTDGGHTWESLPAPEIRGIVRFISPSTGLVAGLDYSDFDPVPLRRTDDGGLTWHMVSLLPTGADSVWANADATRLWAVGQDGLIALSTDGGATWITVASPTAVDLYDVRFADDKHGWAAGEGGVALHTTDGGWHWSLVDTGATADVTGLATTSAHHAWIYTEGLRRTVDGGASWQTLPHVAGDIASLSMASATAGWAATDRSVLKTTNAGGLWSEQAGTGAATVVESVDAQHAWTLSATQLQRTVDGVAWQTIALPGVREARDLDFVDAAHGWMAAQADQIVPGCLWDHHAEQIYRTLDGGLTWTPLFNGSEPWRCESELRQVAFVDASHGWAAGRRELLRTADGGATWHSVNANSGTVSIDFVDALQGWRIRSEYDHTLLERTQDGGATWEQILAANNSYYSPGYRIVDFVTAKEGWVAGDQGMVLYTRDGGVTWSYGWFSDYNLSGLAALPSGQAWFGGQNGFIGRFSASQPAGCWATPTPRPPYTGTPPASGAVDRRVAHCMDDAYVRLDTGEFLYDAEVVRIGAQLNGAAPVSTGFLFRDVRIPQGARITGAYLELAWQGQDGAPVEIELAGELSPDATDFRPLGWQPQLRLRTEARVPWTVTSILSGTVTSPEIAHVIEEIIGQPGWQPGNNLAVLVDPAVGDRQSIAWIAYDGDPTRAARLLVSYDTSTVRYLPLIMRR